MRVPATRAGLGSAALRLVLVVVLAGTAVLLAGGALGSRAANEWAGKWKATGEPNGNMTLTQSGTTVTGSYLGTNLTAPYTIKGTVKGLQFTGSYTYMAGDPAVVQGPYPIVWTMSSDLRYITGFRDASKTSFNFERVGSAPAGTTTTTTTTAKKPPTLTGAAYGLMKSFMTQYDTNGFARVTDLGALGVYRSTLAGLKIAVDPKLGAVAQYDPNTKTITFSRDPRTIKPGDLAVGETVWHELTHAIEDRHGDFDAPDANSKLYAEHNIEYMTQVARSALPFLERMERLARAGAPVTKLRQAWNAYLKAMAAANRLPETRKYPPNIRLLRTWFGFDVSPTAVKKLYLSGKALPGAAGASLRKALGP
jgi:hypothetical protein